MPRASTPVSKFDHALVEKHPFNVHCSNPPSTSESRSLKDTWRTIIACRLTSGPRYGQQLTPNVRRLIAVFVLVKPCLGTSLHHTQYRPRCVLEGKLEMLSPTEQPAECSCHPRRKEGGQADKRRRISFPWMDTQAAAGNRLVRTWPCSVLCLY